MPQLSQSAIKELLSLIAERRAEHAKNDQPSLGLASVQKAFESLMAKGQGSNLFWVKPHEQELVTEPVVPVLSHKAGAGSSSPERSHVLIEGDNFHALQVLQQTHRKCVDVIYIDPPYNTNRGDFKYNDIWVDDANRWKHSLWLHFMEKRLRIAETLLADTGLIFISIDDVEVHNLKLLCDDVFGADNHVNTIAVKMSHLSGVKMSHVEKKLPKLKEFVLVYAKNKDKVKLAPIYQPTKWDEALSRYNQFILNIDSDYAEWKSCPVKKAAESQNIDWEDLEAREAFLVANAHRIFRTARNKALSATGVKGKFSRVTSATGLEKFVLNDEEVLFASEKLKPVDGVLAPANALGDIWSDISINNLHNEGGVEFKNGKKPLQLIERILKLVDKRDALVLDFFAGSGTTAQAVIELNSKDEGSRQCIIVTNNEVDKDTAGQLKKLGHVEGSAKWEEAGICHSVTWPRVCGAAQRLSAHASKPRIEHFKLTCVPLELSSLEEGERLYKASAKAEARSRAVRAQRANRAQFAAIAWLEAGALGTFEPQLAEAGQGTGFTVIEKSTDLPSRLEGIRLVYLLTDTPIALPGASLSAAACRIAKRFPDEQHVRVKELWIDYVKNFPVEG